MRLAAENPDLPAAAVAMSGRAMPATELVATPLWYLIGEHDEKYSPAEGRKMTTGLQQLGARAQFTEVENAGHAILGAALHRDDVFEWLFAQRKTNGGGQASGPHCSG